MARLRLGDLLVKAGVITDSQLRVALAQQRQHGGKLGEHLVRTNLVSEQQLAIAIADQLGLVYNGCTSASAAQFSAILPENVAVQLQVLPVRLDAGTDTLHVAVADPLDEKLKATLLRVTGKRIELQVAPKSLLRQFIKVAYANIEIDDEGTNEFQLVDINGRESSVRVSSFGGQTPTRSPSQVPSDDEELPEASLLEMEPISVEHSLGAQAPAAHASMPFAPASPGVAAQPTPAQGHRPAARAAAPFPTAAARRVTPPPGAVHAAPPAMQHPPSDAGEEALRLLWAMSDLLIERGYFSRAELMSKLRTR